MKPLKDEYFMSLKQEAQKLSRQTGLRKEACEKWMNFVGIRGVLDLMGRYPGALYDQCIARAGQEIEDYILGS